MENYELIEDIDEFIKFIWIRKKNSKAPLLLCNTYLSFLSPREWIQTISSLQNKLNFWWLGVRLINHLKRIKNKWELLHLTDHTKKYNSHIPEKKEILEKYYKKQWFTKKDDKWFMFI